MEKKEVVEEVEKVLLNPHGLKYHGEIYQREQCIDKCEGCDRMFSDENIGDVCMPYLYPGIKWKNYRVETEQKKVLSGTDKGKDTTIFYHYNPCPMATHIKHSPKKIELRGRRGWKRQK